MFKIFSRPLFQILHYDNGVPRCNICPHTSGVDCEPEINGSGHKRFSAGRKRRSTGKREQTENTRGNQQDYILQFGRFARTTLGALGKRKEKWSETLSSSRRYPDSRTKNLSRYGTGYTEHGTPDRRLSRPYRRRRNSKIIIMYSTHWHLARALTA